jgi:hypothetical protein
LDDPLTGPAEPSGLMVPVMVVSRAGRGAPHQGDHADRREHAGRGRR